MNYLIELLRGLDGCDLIVHAGDLCSPEAIEGLERIAPVSAVHGNCDPPNLQSTLPSELRLQAEQFSILVTHGHQGKTAMSTAQSVSAKDNADCVIFGHSHKAYVDDANGLLLLNPGSPTWPRFDKRRSFALLTVTHRLEAVIIPLP